MAREIKNSSFKIKPDYQTTQDLVTLHPVIGAIIYNTDTNTNQYWNGTSWVSGLSSISNTTCPRDTDTTDIQAQQLVQDSAILSKVDKVTGSSLITDASILRLANTSGTNTGDQNLSGFQLKSEKDLINGYAGLNASGKINPAQLPALAITDTFVTASEAEMLALTAEVGDISIRTDLSQTFILQTTGATLLANWQEIQTPTAEVGSVFGRTGVITAENNDYTFAQVDKTVSSLADLTTREFAALQLKPTTVLGYGITDAFTKTEITALDVQNVKLTGNQSVAGEKTFTANVTAPKFVGDGSLLTNMPVSPIQQTALDLKLNTLDYSDATLPFTDITTGNFSNTKHGFAPKGTDKGYFLRDDGVWASNVAAPPVSSVANFNNAGDFVMFSTSGAITNAGASTITGKVGTHVGAITGFGTIAGSFHSADTLTQLAKDDLIAAEIVVSSLAPTDTTHAATYGGGEFLVAGVYSNASAISVSGELNLDAQGDPDSIFVFKVTGAIAMAAGVKINLINGARVLNVFFVATGAISTGAGSTIIGNFIAKAASITIGANGYFNGGLYSIDSTVTFNSGVAIGTLSIPLNQDNVQDGLFYKQFSNAEQVDLSLNSLDRHTNNVNRVTLDKFSEDAGGNLLFQGSGLGGSMVYNGLDNSSTSVASSANNSKVLKDVQDLQQIDIDLNTAKVGYTDVLVSANADVVANTAKVSYEQPVYTLNTYYAELGGFVFQLTPNGKHGLVVAMVDQAKGSYNASPDSWNLTAQHDAAGKEFTDWRLPGRGELNAVYRVKEQIGVFQNDWYWTRTGEESNISSQRIVSFTNQTNAFGNRTNLYWTRVVRSF